MIKKYEIIMDGGVKRIKALRSFHVQGRYVNVGDVGGIVYDENTLSQEGNGWIFSGNLNYPSIRVSGDSIVDTNGYEANVTDPRPFVNITGASALIGAHDFVTGAVAARELAVADVEQGTINIVAGATYEGGKVNSVNAIRLKSLIYTGKTTGNITASGEGYEIQVVRLNSDKRITGASSWGATVAISGADYIGIRIRKKPEAAIVPADIAEAKVALPALPLEAYLDINDSRMEFQYTGAMTVVTKVNPGNATSGVCKSVIDTSNVVISKKGNGVFVANIFADVVKCNAAWTLVSLSSMLSGDFRNVSNLMIAGTTTWDSAERTRPVLRVYDCYDFLLTSTVISTAVVNAANAANMPFIFTRCNVPNGIFYHNAQAKNIYTDIDFARASVDLGKTISGTDYQLVSSEVEGMYRIYDTVSKTLGCLVEAYDSVAGLTSMGANSYNTTIYKDANFNGKFDFAGTNVFGNTRKHDTTITVYNGCKIVNTGTTAVNMKGNIRVEGNATLVNASITGTGYFGGNSVVNYNPAEWASLDFVGTVYMKDKTVFAPTALTGACALVRMEGNAKFIGSVTAPSTNLSFIMRDNAVIEGKANTQSGVVMSGNSRVAPKGSISADSRGALVMKDNASIEANTTVIGAITLAGNYKGDVIKTWTGKRTITDVNEPEYDDNVKTEYDF